MTGNERCNQAALIALIAVATFITEFDATVVNIALPNIASSYHISASSASMVVLTYIVGMVSFIFMFGKISGNGFVRIIFLAGTVIFGVFSVVCGIAPSFETLVVCRFLQGLGGSMVSAALPILVIRYMSPDKHGLGMSILAAATGVALVIGPSAGGFICGLLSWHWVFFINVPICLGIVALTFKTVPRRDRSIVFEMFDVQSTVCLAGLIICTLVMLQSLVDKSLPTVIVPPMAILAIASLVILIRRLRNDKVKNPVLNIRIFENREVVMLGASFLLTTIIAMGVQCTLPYYFEYAMGVSVSKSGMFLTIACIATVIVSTPVGRYCDRHGCKIPAAIAVLFRAVFSVAFAFIIPEWGLIPLIAALIIMGISFGMSGTSQPTRMVHHADPGTEGEVTSFMMLINYIGASIGVVLYTFLFTAFAPGSGGIPISEMSAESIINGLHYASIGGIVLAIIALFFTMRVRNIVPKGDSMNDGE